MNRSFAASIGALVGAVLKLQFGGGWFFTTLSLVAGGIVGWVGCDLGGFFRGVGRAFRDTFTPIMRWRLNQQRAGWAFLHGISVMIRSVSVWSVVLPVLVFCESGVGGFVRSLTEIFSFSPSSLIGFAFFSPFVLQIPVLIAIETYRGVGQRNNIRLIRGSRAWVTVMRSWRATLLYGNLIAWALWIVIGLIRLIMMTPKLMMITIKGVNAAIKAMWSFLQLSFAYTHSDLRKTCFIDAVIGAAIGIYFGMPAVGASFGAIVSYAHFDLTNDIALRIKERHEARQLAPVPIE